MLMKDNFVVFSKRLAKALVAQGFVLKDTQPNKLRKGYYVYIFENSMELKNAIAKTTKNTKTIPNK